MSARWLSWVLGIPALALGADFRVPAGFHLGNDQNVALFASPGGGVQAIDLCDGQVRWTSMAGDWPLDATAWTLPIARMDPDNVRALRVVFLDPSTRRVQVTSEPILLPFWVERGKAAVSVAGQIRGQSLSYPLAADLQLRWTVQQGARSESGEVSVDPQTGRLLTSSEAARLRSSAPNVMVQFPEPPPLPPRDRFPADARFFERDGDVARWGPTPTVFRAPDGGGGVFVRDARNRVYFYNWSPSGMRKPVPVGIGFASYLPVVDLHGNNALVTARGAGWEQLTLWNLGVAGKVISMIDPLPYPLRGAFLFLRCGAITPMIYPSEELPGAPGSTLLVAYDDAAGRVLWTRPVGARGDEAMNRSERW